FNRLFYNKLDVSISPRTENDLARYNIVTGSGYRASPLLDEGFNNRLYFVFDRNIQGPKTVDTDQDGYPDAVSYDYQSVVELDESVTYSRVAASDLSAKVNSIVLDTVGAHKHGFFLNLATGTKEKMINPTLTNDGIVLAVSYSPTSVVTNSGGDICEKNIGSSSLYQIDLYSGEAARLDLAKAGISTKPIVIEVEDDDDPDTDGTVKVLIVGSESFDGSQDLDVNDGDIDELVNPGLNDSNVGKVIKANWWEKRN
ncbi:MAG: Tfp pilus tip-associated adhesin PilY1, partial [Cryomorphaceae bacterium]